MKVFTKDLKRALLTTLIVRWFVTSQSWNVIRYTVCLFFTSLLLISSASGAYALEVQLLAFRPSVHFRDTGRYLFTAHVSGAFPQTDYTLISYHHPANDIDYGQERMIVTTKMKQVVFANFFACESA